MTNAEINNKTIQIVIAHFNATTYLNAEINKINIQIVIPYFNTTTYLNNYITLH